MAPLLDFEGAADGEPVPEFFTTPRAPNQRRIGGRPAPVRSRRLVPSTQDDALAYLSEPPPLVASAHESFLVTLGGDDRCDSARNAFRLPGAAAYAAPCVADPLSELSDESDCEGPTRVTYPRFACAGVYEEPPVFGVFQATALDDIPAVFRPISQEALPDLHVAGLNTVGSLPPWAEENSDDQTSDSESECSEPSEPSVLDVPSALANTVGSLPPWAEENSEDEASDSESEHSVLSEISELHMPSAFASGIVSEDNRQDDELPPPPSLLAASLGASPLMVRKASQDSSPLSHTTSVKSIGSLQPLAEQGFEAFGFWSEREFEVLPP